MQRCRKKTETMNDHRKRKKRLGDTITKQRDTMEIQDKNPRITKGRKLSNIWRYAGKLRDAGRDEKHSYIFPNDPMDFAGKIKIKFHQANLEITCQK